MNVWRTSWLYRIWVVGGLLGIVAFAVIGGLSDPSNQGFVLYLIGVIAVWMAGILVLQWRGIQRDVRERPGLRPMAGLLRWNVLFAAALCVAIFAGVFLFYSGVGRTLYPLGESGPGLPVVLVPAVALALLGALRTLNLLRGAGGDPGGTTGGDAGPEGPTDIQASPRRKRSP